MKHRDIPPKTFHCSDPSHDGQDLNDIYRIQSHAKGLLPDGREWIDPEGEMCSECHVIRWADRYGWVEIEQRSGYHRPPAAVDIWHRLTASQMRRVFGGGSRNYKRWRKEHE